ncbi:MAG: YggS family pyridoxal phosphate-dependent enzyme [Lachnospiraceae bacterium]|nr:YggS family pyridoxal phosphate-dependent enzyme [Lachnospiraceae bacterium]
MIKAQLKDVEDRINEACLRANRDPKDVTLIAVSKTKPLSDLEQVLDSGVIEFGENKVQELVDKYEHIKSPVHWHMIGHLQTNKVKYIVDKVEMIHSVDSFKLASVISKEASKKNVTVNILIEVNVAKEESKFGITLDEVKDLVTEISSLPNISIKGLMTIAPFVDNPEDNRMVFRSLYNMAQEIKALNIDNVSMDELSMGMTNDFEVAIEEGATFVRVGTAIFGTRNYNI